MRFFLTASTIPTIKITAPAIAMNVMRSPNITCPATIATRLWRYMKLVDFYKVVDGFKIGDFNVNFIEMLSGNEDVGTDDKNVYERVIEFRICYNPYIS